MSGDLYCSTFCNNAHRLYDGKPVNHQCFVLPTEMLYAEQRGDFARAQLVMTKWKKRRIHNGVKCANT